MNAVPKTMKAAVLVESGSPLEIVEVGLPEVIGRGQVLVRVHFSGICGAQLGEIDATKGEDKYLPHLLGHEGSGTVVQVGSDVTSVAVGDRVVLHWKQGSGIQSDTPKYSLEGKQVNAGWVTTFNEYAVVSENRVTTIAPDTDLRIAALFGCAVTTAFGVIRNNAKIKNGESLVVFGSGGVGLNMMQAAALAGATPIIAVDKYQNRLNLAGTLGATHLINSTQEDARSRIIEIVGSHGVDCFIDNTGVPSIIEMGYEITATRGRVVLVGVPRTGENISIYTLPIHFGKQLIGSHGGDTNPDIDIPELLGLVRSKTIDLENVITDEFDLDDINSAISSMRSGMSAGRCLVRL